MDIYLELMSAITEARTEGALLGMSLPGFHRTPRLMAAIAARNAEISGAAMRDAMGDE